MSWGILLAGSEKAADNDFLTTCLATQRDESYSCTLPIIDIQGDQLYMAVCLWNFVKCELTSERVYSSLHWTSYLSKGTRKTRSCSSGQIICHSKPIKPTVCTVPLLYLGLLRFLIESRNKPIFVAELKTINITNNLCIIFAQS